jgi:hypothetical protein
MGSAPAAPENAINAALKAAIRLIIFLSLPHSSGSVVRFMHPDDTRTD